MCQNSVKGTGRRKMDKNTRSRKNQLTFNNPHKFKDCSHEGIKRSLQQWENIIYWCMCDEIGAKEQTPHTHLYIEFKNPIYFSSLKKVFPYAHIEQAKGSAQQNRDYIRKEGKWENSEKETTNLKDTFEEWGEMPQYSQGKRNDRAELYQMIKDGLTNTQILEVNPDNILNLHQIDKARVDILAEKYRTERRVDLQVIYVCGKTGTGKSRGILDEHGDKNVCRVTDYKHPFDSYYGQDVLVFEEFRSDLTIGAMLNYLDIYPFQLPARYNNKQACYHFVYIVSNWNLEDQYPNVYQEQKETYMAFLRRIHKVRIYEDMGVYTEYTLKEYFERLDREHNPFEK